MYPKKLPLDKKPTWFYSDCFPTTRPYLLVDCFLHINYSMNMHSHDFYELNLIVSGKGVHYTYKSLKVVTPGDIIVIPPGSYHGYYNIEDLNVFHILIHKNFFSKYYNDLNMLSAFGILFNADYKMRNVNADIPFFNVENEEYQKFYGFFEDLRLLCASLAHCPQEEIISKHLVSYAKTLIIISELCTEYNRQFLSSQENQSNKTDLAILSIVDYVHQHYAEKISLDDLCAKGFMAKTTLLEKFNKYMGQSPMSYVNHYRILVAKKLLIETDKSISEIAVSTGFFDTSHFIKTYEKYENVSPNKLRKSLKN